MEEISLVGDNHNGDNSVFEDIDVSGNTGAAGCFFDDETAINGVEDIWKVNFKNLTMEEVMSYHFSNVEVAFLFYNWYASMHGFGARKSRKLRNIKGEVTGQTFLCYREGYRKDMFKNTGRVQPLL